MQEVFEKIIKKLGIRAEKSEKKEMDAEHFEYAQMYKGERIAFGDAIEIVKQEAEKYNNGWISCSERMPEDGQVVLTCKCKRISILRYSTKTNHWYELSGNWWWSANMVAAWQPFPAPYQPNGE